MNCLLLLLKAWITYLKENIFKSILFDTSTVKNIVIPPNFLVWKFCGKTQFPHNFGRIVRNFVETVPFHKLPHPEIRWNYSTFCTVRAHFFSIRHSLILQHHFLFKLNYARAWLYTIWLVSNDRSFSSFFQKCSQVIFYH